jgi:hypothetical protein
MLWGVTSGVANCRFEELLSPIPKIGVINVSVPYLRRIETSVRSGKRISIGQYRFSRFRPDRQIKGNLISWDFIDAEVLARLVPGHPDAVMAHVSQRITMRADAYVRENEIPDRLGIRVRVEEYLSRNRKPHRVRKELDDAIKQLVSISPYTRVFIATDSEYVQQRLVSHFQDAKYLDKPFDLKEPTGRYIRRQDKAAISTFLEEVECLCRCKRIINVGGFLNDESVAEKFIPNPAWGWK